MGGDFATMTKRRSLVPALLAAACVTLLGVMVWPAPAATQTSDEALATTLTGTWNLAISEDAARAAIEEGITASVASLPPLIDTIAANQLRERTILSRSITLSVTATRIESRFSHATFSSAPGMPVRVPVPGAAGETMEMTQLLRGGALEQIFTTDSGRRWSTFTPSADGARLTLSAVVHSERLTTDLRFRLPYRRAE